MLLDCYWTLDIYVAIYVYHNDYNVIYVYIYVDEPGSQGNR